MTQIQLPNNWTPRPYQLEAWMKFNEGHTRQLHVWNRRAGKDSFSLNLAAVQAHKEVGSYWHLFPLQTQARKAIWHGIGKDGTRFIDQAFPRELRRTTRENDMMIEFRNGSTWQMVGSDNYNALVGSNPKGVVFSEAALADPAAWDYIRPIIAENKGWVMMISTYRGKNWFYKMHQRVKNDPNWFCSVKTVDDTKALSKEALELEKREMDRALFMQEYYCSPMAAFRGAFWIKEMMKMQTEHRITSVSYEDSRPVYAAFDLGMDDLTTVLFVQEKGNEPRIIGSRGYRMTSIEDIVHDIRNDYPWGKNIDTYVLPWDGGPAQQSTGKPLSQTVEEMGEQVYVVPRTKSVLDDVNLCRQFLKRTWIDNEKRPYQSDNEDNNNERLIEALQGYRTEESNKDPEVFQLSPAHTWESHYADAWRTYCKFRHLEGDSAGWSEGVNYSNWDKGVI